MRVQDAPSESSNKRPATGAAASEGDLLEDLKELMRQQQQAAAAREERLMAMMEQQQTLVQTLLASGSSSAEAAAAIAATAAVKAAGTPVPEPTAQVLKKITQEASADVHEAPLLQAPLPQAPNLGPPFLCSACKSAQLHGQ